MVFCFIFFLALSLVGELNVRVWIVAYQGQRGEWAVGRGWILCVFLDRGGSIGGIASVGFLSTYVAPGCRDSKSCDDPRMRSEKTCPAIVRVEASLSLSLSQRCLSHKVPPRPRTLHDARRGVH